MSSDDTPAEAEQTGKYGYISVRSNGSTGPAEAGEQTDNYPLLRPLVVPVSSTPPPAEVPLDVQAALYLRRKTLRRLNRIQCTCKATRTLAAIYATSLGPFVWVVALRRPKQHRSDADGHPTWAPMTNGLHLANCPACVKTWLIVTTPELMTAEPLGIPTFGARGESRRVV